MACNMSSSARTNGLLVFQDTRNWIGGVMNCSLYEIPLKVNNETFWGQKLSGSGVRRGRSRCKPLKVIAGLF
jgi:hypothetical protein